MTCMEIDGNIRHRYIVSVVRRLSHGNRRHACEDWSVAIGDWAVRRQSFFLCACFQPSCALAGEIPRPVMGPGVVCGDGPGAVRGLPVQAPIGSGRPQTLTSTATKRGTP